MPASTPMMPEPVAVTQPAAGVITTIKLRLSATATGTAINAAVGDLATTEASGKAGRFYVTVDTTLLQTHLLPLGVGQAFYAIWSKAGDMDMESVKVLVGAGTVN